MFLKYNVSQEASELIKKILLAQVESPLKNNWWLDVKSDLASFNINLSLEEIKSMEKESFAKLVKEKCRENFFKDLMAMKSTHSKMENLKYPKMPIKGRALYSRTNVFRVLAKPLTVRKSKKYDRNYRSTLKVAD